MDISVIVPIYYGNHYIDEMIKQIEDNLDGNKYEVEVILINDSPDVPLQYTYDSSRVVIRVIEMEKNVGIHRARVRGLKSSIGEYILFLDQDDKIYNDYFSKQMKSVKDFDASVCSIINGDRREFVGERYSSGKITLQGMINEGNYIRSPGQVLIKKNSIPSLWIEMVLSNNGADDWLLWILMLKENYKFSIVNEVMFTHELHADNTSSHSLTMHLSEQEMKHILIKSGILSDDEIMRFDFLLEKQDRKRLLESDLVRKKAYFYKKLLEKQKQGISLGDTIDLPRQASVFIYGFGEIGKFLYEELTIKGYLVCGFIDKDADNIYSLENVVRTGNYIDNVDVIIISLLKNIPDLKELLHKTYGADIFDLRDFIEGDF